MRLTNFVCEREYFSQQDVEEQEYQKMKHEIFKRCKPFLEDIKGASSLLYRPVVQPLDGQYDEIDVKRHANPEYVDDTLKSLIHDYSKERWGWNIETEGMFTTKNYKQAKEYAGQGSVVIVFPIGKYKYVYSSDSEEMRMGFNMWKWQLDELLDKEYDSDRDYIRKASKELFDYLMKEQFDKYEDDNILSYLNGNVAERSECIIHCEEVFYIDKDLTNRVLMEIVNG